MNDLIINHWVITAKEINSDILSEKELLVPAVKRLIERLSLTSVSDHFHVFGPGVSYLVVLSESHLAIHTWPELNFIHLDLVVCTINEKLSESNIQLEIKNVFNTNNIIIQEVK